MPDAIAAPAGSEAPQTITTDSAPPAAPPQQAESAPPSAGDETLYFESTGTPAGQPRMQTAEAFASKFNKTDETGKTDEPASGDAPVQETAQGTDTSATATGSTTTTEPAPPPASTTTPTQAKGESVRDFALRMAASTDPETRAAGDKLFAEVLEKERAGTTQATQQQQTATAFDREAKRAEIEAAERERIVSSARKPARDYENWNGEGEVPFKYDENGAQVFDDPIADNPALQILLDDRVERLLDRAEAQHQAEQHQSYVAKRREAETTSAIEELARNVAYNAFPALRTKLADGRAAIDMTHPSAAAVQADMMNDVPAIMHTIEQNVIAEGKQVTDYNKLREIAVDYWRTEVLPRRLAYAQAMVPAASTAKGEVAQSAKPATPDAATANASNGASVQKPAPQRQSLPSTGQPITPGFQSRPPAPTNAKGEQVSVERELAKPGRTHEYAERFRAAQGLTPWGGR